MLRSAVAIFLGAFLLFLVQPLMGRYILPWFGGGPGVWTTCMVFFQVVLLGGYAYAHLVASRLPPRAQMVVHLLLLAMACAFLPVIPSAAWKPVGGGGDDPTWRILLLLLASLGAPYLALSATGPLVQAWFARANPGRSPWRLYALSNAGSLLALMIYPFVLEPALTRRMQSIVWSVGFGLFVIACGWCAIGAGRNGSAAHLEKAATPERAAPAGNGVAEVAVGVRRLLWVLLPMCASVLLLAVTNRITQDVAPVPLLWVVPLAVYLVTFIIAFEWPGLYRREVFLPALIGVIWLLAYMSSQDYVNLRTTIGAHLAALGVCAMVCHGELYRLRPAASRLTGYYLAISLGGALGGVFVSIIAPLVFAGYWEYNLALFGTAGLALATLMADPGSRYFRGDRRREWLVAILALTGAGFVMGRTSEGLGRDFVLAARSRNFYGVLSLYRAGIGRDSEYLQLQHGAIIHGAQFILPRIQRYPTMYYGPRTGVGLLLENLPKKEPRRIGAVGLGIGTLSTYGRPGDVYRFYEINPEVKRIAEENFAFLSTSPATVEVVLGDARLSLEREEPQRFDVLVLDAFNGDAVPVHLLTMEAFDTYERHLQPDGVIAVHVTNNYLDLHQVMRRLARERGLDMYIIDSEGEFENLNLPSRWVLLTRNPEVFNVPEIARAGHRGGGGDGPESRLWTDEQSNLFEILR